MVATRQVTAARATRALSTATTDRTALDIPALVTAAAAYPARSAAASSLVAVRIMELGSILRMLVTVIIQVIYSYRASETDIYFNAKFCTCIIN
ncbi:MAG: hypothetical protein GY696_26655 [Gammaproteobacteria bacterium]|nr:hypothetical protein [Gammaproteobacteria bacterium]